VARIADFQDAMGLIHLRMSPKMDQSENPILFTAQAKLFYPLCYNIGAIESKLGFRANAARAFRSHFSHDNMTGLYCYKILAGISVNHLPVARWNNRWWLHPRDLAFYFYCHYPRLGLLFLWISSLAMIFSCLGKYKYRNGQRYIKTDGKLLAYLRCKAAHMPVTFWICTKIIENHEYFNSWHEVAKKYFGEHHPIVNEYKKAGNKFR